MAKSSKSYENAKAHRQALETARQAELAATTAREALRQAEAVAKGHK